LLLQSTHLLSIFSLSLTKRELLSNVTWNSPCQCVCSWLSHYYLNGPKTWTLSPDYPISQGEGCKHDVRHTWHQPPSAFWDLQSVQPMADHNPDHTKWGINTVSTFRSLISTKKIKLQRSPVILHIMNTSCLYYIQQSKLQECRG
jgi:hypothetical protein